MPLGFFITTKANLLAEKYTFSYSPLVLWWPPLSHFKGKRECFLASPWLQHLLKICYNIPNIGKKALHQGSRQALLSHNRHLPLPLCSLALLGQLWLGRRARMGMPIHVCIHLSLEIVKRSAIRKTQRRIQSGHAVWGLDEPAVRSDLSLMKLKINSPSWGFRDSRQWSRSQVFGLNTAYSTVCARGYLQRKEEGSRD